MLGDVFFPGTNHFVSTMASFATFFVGFVARPLSGAVFGHLGDRIGRKKMLVLTMFLMGIATTGIGLLPGYATIGIWAPILLVLLRILQGIAVGGEWGGAVLMASEHAPQGRKTFFASFPQMGSPAGLILSLIAFGSVKNLGVVTAMPTRAAPGTRQLRATMVSLVAHISQVFEQGHR
ncbi:hypothetical protein PPGU19_089310 (plasmid) [Paraburkholderia sp. PGU19]|nr:hypothetical protein PPGU19_089310 [Paraburkholderia sp. PGU19]